MIIDLVTHPSSPGNNPGTVPYLFRWFSAMNGTFTVVVAVFIMRRVPRNINGLLLFLWGVGATVWSLRADFG
jgi:dolichyl-phosphate-mannose--protein O-mannosyl transferase